MTTHTENALTIAIDKIVTEKTFSMDGVKAIEALREKAETQFQALTAEIEFSKMLRHDLREKDDRIKAYEAREARLAKREEDLSKREVAITALEKDTAVANAKFNVLDSFTGRLLANRIVRETILNTQPIQMGATSSSPGYVVNYEAKRDVTSEQA